MNMKKLSVRITAKPVFTVAVTIWLAATLAAQVRTGNVAGANYASQCNDHMTRTLSRLPAQETAQEVRVLPANAVNFLKLSGGDTGGIVVDGSKENEIVIVGCKTAWAQNEAEARQLLDHLFLLIENGEVSAQGPARTDIIVWQINFIVFVPSRMRLELRARDGGIALRGLQGQIEARTENGGISFRGSGGDVTLQSQNGGIEVSLEQAAWEGKGLSAHSDNGGLIVRVPETYQSGILAVTAANQLQCKAALCAGSEKTWDSRYKILTTTRPVVVKVSTEHAPLQILELKTSN
jgi:hypothetical protein